jgi:predicted RNA-binding Zn-ribbon protein involved in translation (DUF1610 family)
MFSRTMTEVAPTRRSTTKVSFEVDAVKKPSVFVEETKSEPITSKAVLKDKVARKFVEEQKNSLRRLVSQQRKPLQSLGCHMNHGGSLRSILTDKFLKQLEQDATETTEDMSDFSMSESQFHGQIFFDFDEQQRALDLFNNGDSDDTDEDSSFQAPQPVEPTPTPSSSAGNVEVAPGVFVSLRVAAETWQAIKYGCTTQTTCQNCQADLHVIEDAEHIVCPDCWMIGPSRSRSSLPQRGSTPSGSEAPSSLPCPPSSRCGSPSRSTMSLDPRLSTASAFKRFGHILEPRAM